MTLPEAHRLLFINCDDLCFNKCLPVVNQIYYHFEQQLSEYKKRIEELEVGYLEKWQPKEGEWCWKGSLFIRIDAVKNLNREDGLLTYTYSVPAIQESFTSSFIPEPFIGELPRFLKDK